MVKAKLPEAEKLFNRKTCSRYVSMNQRCNNQNNPNYKFYGARGIKVKITHAEYKEFTRQEIKRLGYDINSYNDLVEFFDKYHMDRIDGNSNYELGNIQFIGKRYNSYVQGKAIHLLLKKDRNKELWCPAWCFDMVLSRRTRTAKEAIKANELRGITITKKNYIALLYRDINKPPVPIDKDFCIQCFNCGEKVKLYKTSYFLYDCKNCGVVRTYDIPKQKRMVKNINRKDIEEGLEYLYQHLRSYDGKT